MENSASASASPKPTTSDWHLDGAASGSSIGDPSHWKKKNKRRRKMGLKRGAKEGKALLDVSFKGRLSPFFFFSSLNDDDDDDQWGKRNSLLPSSLFGFCLPSPPFGRVGIFTILYSPYLFLCNWLCGYIYITKWTCIIAGAMLGLHGMSCYADTVSKTRKKRRR